MLKDVRGLGKRYEERDVSEGHATNYLIPNKLAIAATGAAARQIQSLKEGEMKHKEAELHKLEEEVRKLASTTISIKEKANEKNHLFASITAEKLSGLLKERGIDVPADCIALESPIKELGVREVPIDIKGKRTHFTLVIEAK